MSTRTTSRQFREHIVGRTIAGVIARPGRNGEPPIVLMLRFEDGGVIEFVSPRSDRLLKRALRERAAVELEENAESGAAQMSLEGLMSGFGRREAA